MHQFGQIVFAIVFSIFCTSSVIVGQTTNKEITIPTNMEEKIDSLFDNWNNMKTPGASVAVMHQGKVIFSKGYGSANLEYDIPIEPNTIFHIASISKQFTAFAILLLQEEGKLSIDDEIQKYIPEVPDFGRKITLRHLVTHTSGMRDQWNLLAMAGWRLDDVITKEHIMSVVTHQEELNFDPGEQYTYCNTGFTLLAEVVARISGMTFAEFTQERIFEPLGMTNTLFYDDHMKIVKNRAYSYQLMNWQLRKRVLSYANAGATSLFTTVEDIMKWAHNFSTMEIGNSHIFDQMNTEAVLNDGSTFGGGMGQFIDEHNGHLQIQHGGADAGYRSYLGRFPEFDFAVAVFSNLGEFNPPSMSLQVADIFLPEAGDRGELEEVANQKDYNFIELSKKQLVKHAGTYWNEDGVYSRRIHIRDDTLRYNRGFSASRIVPIDENTFVMLDVDDELIVSFDEQEGNKRMVVTINGGDPIISDAYEAPSYSPEDLEDFTGDYYSKELNTNYVLSVSEGGLVAHHYRHGKMTFKSLKADLFEADRWYFGTVQFTRDDTGAVDGIKVSNGRVMNLHFQKR